MELLYYIVNEDKLKLMFTFSTYWMLVFYLFLKLIIKIVLKVYCIIAQT